ncbi:MAG: hypothetical protein ACRDIU_03420 [Actinomycetota bacterium]
MGCNICGRIQTDPVKGASPWGRMVLKGEQVLICPDCQKKDPSWATGADRCRFCGSTRLSIVLGSLVCRGCGKDAPRE